MNISRDTRIDRRRRVLRDASLQESGQDHGESVDSRSRRNRPRAPDNCPDEGSLGKRSAGYSQDVRRACGTRLVQLIPVRLVSFLAVVVSSLCLTGLLLTIHYCIYVSGKLDWYGNPMAVSFDATHPQSIAAWLGSHLWLLCLASTILTFQLRRHKLDDYTGEYRLWFWLVLTCILAGVDSTTHISELLGYSIDRWTQSNMGWSGKAVVQSTMAVLVGVLGIRLCSELKSVPFSLICWLVGLSMWAGAAALAQDAFRIDISVQMRFWLRATFWLGGLTLIWIASLAYLRHVYIEAQRRFLQRYKSLGRSSRTAVTQRLKQSFSGNLLSAVGLRKNQDAEDTPASVTNRRSARTASDASAPSSNRWNFRLWPGKSSRADEALEYSKVVRAKEAISGSDKNRTESTRPQQDSENPSLARDRDRQAKQAEKAAAIEAQRAAKESKLKEKQAQREAARQARLERKRTGRGWKWSRLIPLPAVGTLLGKLKLPSLSGLKLTPPEPDASSDAAPPSPAQGPRPVTNDRPLPGTVRFNPNQNEDGEDDRQLSRAERKKQRRQGRAA